MREHQFSWDLAPVAQPQTNPLSPRAQIRLAEIFPDKRVVGIEIRDKVSSRGNTNSLKLGSIHIRSSPSCGYRRGFNTVRVGRPMRLALAILQVHEYLHERIKALREERPGQARTSSPATDISWTVLRRTCQHQLLHRLQTHPVCFEPHKSTPTTVRERRSRPVQCPEAPRAFLPQGAAREDFLPVP